MSKNKILNQKESLGMKKILSAVLGVVMIVVMAVPTIAAVVNVPDGYGIEYSTPEFPFTFISADDRAVSIMRYGVLGYGYVNSTSNVNVYSSADKTNKIGFVGHRERVYVLYYSGDHTMYCIEFMNVNTRDRGFVDASKITVRTSWERPITTGRISQDFMENNHAGIDVAAPAGTDVYAVKNVQHESRVLTGIVNGNRKLVNYGNHIVCTISDNTVIYGHLSSFANGEASTLDSYRCRFTGSKTLEPKATWTPDAGDAIGGVGNTGWSTGNHLHFEVYKTSSTGTKVDPFRFVVFPDIGY